MIPFFFSFLFFYGIQTTSLDTPNHHFSPFKGLVICYPFINPTKYLFIFFLPFFPLLSFWMLLTFIPFIVASALAAIQPCLQFSTSSHVAAAAIVASVNPSSSAANFLNSFNLLPSRQRHCLKTSDHAFCFLLPKDKQTKKHINRSRSDKYIYIYIYKQVKIPNNEIKKTSPLLLPHF